MNEESQHGLIVCTHIGKTFNELDRWFQANYETDFLNVDFGEGNGGLVLCQDCARKVEQEVALKNAKR